MSLQRLAMLGVFAAVAVSLAALAFLQSPGDEYVYVQSDITKANPNIAVAPTHATVASEEISDVKRSVVLTVKGTVLSVDDPIDWIDESKNPLGFVPVTIKVDEKSKDTAGLKLNKGDHFVVYLGGVYESGVFYVHGFEPQFEIGEEVLLHVGHDSNGPDFEDAGLYFVELGKHGKYKVVGEKAYNDKNREGKSLDQALDEAN